MSTQPKSAARSIADVGEGIILATVDIAVPAERVFRALTDSAEVVQWWGSDEAYRTTGWRADVRVGGTWRADGRGADGHDFFVEGEFLEVDPPRKLVQTWKAQWDGGATTTLTYRLEPIETGTRLIVRHTGFQGRPESCTSHAFGWEMVLGWLTAHLAKSAPAAEPKVFVGRLWGPRPTFPMDMTASERELMGAHVAHWMPHVQAGRLLVFGPVMDPSGVWGLAVVRGKDEAEMRAIADADPVITANVGFRYDILPMQRAILAG